MIQPDDVIITDIADSPEGHVQFAMHVLTMNDSVLGIQPLEEAIEVFIGYYIFMCIVVLEFLPMDQNEMIGAWLN